MEEWTNVFRGNFINACEYASLGHFLDSSLTAKASNY